MLKKFEVANFKGFSRRLVFDLTAHDYAFNPNLVKNGIVKNCLIYGPNGIGKTNLGLALFDLVEHLTDKKPISGKYITDYKNLETPDDKAVEFRYVFLFENVGEVIYEYAKNAQRELVWERMSLNGKQMVYWNYFEKDENAIDKSISTIVIELPDNKLSVLKYLYRNLPTGTVPVLTRLIQFAETMLWYRSLSDGNSYAGFDVGHAALDDIICAKDKLNDFSEFLAAHNIHYVLESVKTNDGYDIKVRFPKTGKTAFFSSVASTGTKTLQLFYYWSMVAFGKVSFLFIDEFDAFFHFQSAASIVGQLNKSSFQVALTSHNTYLMQNEFTRPDCCFLMSDSGIRSLPDCTDREIRQAHNLEKMYINGAFV